MQLEWLVVIHVLSAVLGLGPAYAFPFILRRTSSVEEMRRCLSQVATLEAFPKIFGTIALVSGLLLFFVGSYGPFAQTWILGALIAYVLLEALIIGFLNPATQRLQRALAGDPASPERIAADERDRLYARVRNSHAWAGIGSLVIFVLMIVKPD